MLARITAFADRIQRRPTVAFVVQVVEIVTIKNLPGFAQMMAYSILFATVPFLMVLVSGAALITRFVNAEFENPALPVLNWLQQYLPQDLVNFLEGPIQTALNQPHGWALTIGALLSLWGVRGAIAAIIRGLNVSYGIDRDPRGFLVTNSIALVLAVLVILLITLSSILFTLGTTLGNDVADALGLQDLYLTVSAMIRWPTLVVLGVLSVMVLHWLGPANSQPFLWYLPGSIFTVIVIVISTWVLSYWFGIAGGFDQTYGVFGSVMAFIFWLWIMGLVILIGGAINAVIHRYARSSIRPDSV